LGAVPGAAPVGEAASGAYAQHLPFGPLRRSDGDGYDCEEVTALLTALAVLRAEGVTVPVSGVDGKQFTRVPGGFVVEDVHRMLQSLVTGSPAPDQTAPAGPEGVAPKSSRHPSRLRRYADPRTVGTALVLGLGGGTLVGMTADTAIPAIPAVVTTLVTFGVVYGVSIAGGRPPRTDSER
jgi:hypothetical protein